MRQFGSFRLDLENECVWRDDQRLTLTPRPFAVLQYLVENPQRIVTHDELMEALWPETYVQPQVLRTYVLELRKLLGDDPGEPRYIQTVPRRGYRFVSPVLEVGTASDANGAPSRSLIGRDAELAVLHAHLERARREERPTVFITGEAGIGKTSLIDSFCAHHCNTGKLHIARGQSIEGFAGKEAFYPVREALSGLHGCIDEKARELLAAAAPGWFARGANTAAAPSIGEICEALELLSQTDTLLLIFEDVHWADSSTLDLISALARRRSRARLMLIASFRRADVDVQGPLRGLEQALLTGRRGEELQLGPLDKHAVGEYLRRELHAEKLPSGLISLIHQQSAGNPLFMIAVLDHLRVQHLLSAQAGEVTLRRPLSEIEMGVPDGLRSMIELQLERLTDEDRLLLEAGSVTGAIFPAWSAASALKRPLEEMEEAYAALVRRVHLLSIAGQDELPDGTRSSFYVFSHALYREVLYERLPASRRAQWHLRIADRLRTMFAGQEANVAYEIAAHTEAGMGARAS